MDSRKARGALRRGEQPTLVAADIDPAAEPMLSSIVQDHLGEQLRALYASFIEEALPASLRDLVARLEAEDPRGKVDRLAGFARDLLAELPALRAYAANLALSAQADDLVQETLLRAWQNQGSFRPGTNLKAWLFTILRNLFYSHYRKRKREVADIDGALAAQMIDLPSQEHAATLTKVRRELHKLPANQREAVILVGVHGMTYEAAAELLDCRVGTVKSRVSRGRAALSASLGMSGDLAG